MTKYLLASFLLVFLLFQSCVITNPPTPVVLTDSLAGQAKLHGKYFGSAVVHDALFNTSKPELARDYNYVLANQFNLIVPESEMKMANLWTAEKQITYTKIDRIADLAVQNNLKMRAHALVWHRSLPTWLINDYKKGIYTNDQVAVLVEWYITELMTHFKTKYPGLIIAWDVVNEVIGPNDSTLDNVTFGLRPTGYDYLNKGEDFWRMTLGDDYTEKAFQWARAADNQAKLFYNDYHNEYINPKGEAIYSFVTGLQKKGVPIDGIGLQCHFQVSYLDMSKLGITFSIDAISTTVSRWIATGLDVQITEADIGITTNQEQRQADLFSKLLSTTLLKTGVSAFVTWGFTDLVSWKAETNPLYFDAGIKPKTSYFSMLEVLKNWK